MTEPSPDPSIEHEPHLRGGGFKADPSEAKAEETLAYQGAPTDEDRLDQSVWDEPSLSPELAPARPAHDLTYERWLDEGRNRTPLSRTWMLTFLLAAASGPLAILGVFWNVGDSPGSVLGVVLFGPVMEEAMKAAAAAFLVEKRPYLFRSPFQIAICLLASGIAFAAIENLLYLNVYIPNASAGLAAWRWTVCTALHGGCSLIAGLGILRIWRDVFARKARPRLALGLPHLFAAAAIHGLYNLGAVLMEFTRFRF